MTRLTDSDLDALEAAEAKATKGPWEAIHVANCDGHDATIAYVATAIRRGGSKFFGVLSPHEDGGTADACHTGNGPTSEANAILIADLRNALPALLAEIRRGRKIEAAAREYLRCRDELCAVKAGQTPNSATPEDDAMEARLELDVALGEPTP